MRVLYETVAVRHTERNPLTHSRKVGTAPLVKAEKVEAYRAKSEDLRNKTSCTESRLRLREESFQFQKGECTMNKHSMKKLLSLVLCAVLIAAMALSFTGCSDDKETEAPTTGTFTDGQTLGEGGTEFTLTVTDAEGKAATATIRTNKTTVGDALVELGLVAGDTSTGSLYVKTVNGMTYDYEKDGKYWAFYIDGEYAMTGIDSTDIVAGSLYELKAE